MAGMGQLSLKAIVLGLVVGLAVATAGLIVVVVAVGLGSGIDITDVGKNGEVARAASIQLPILATWTLALFLAGMTAGRSAGGRARALHGGVIGGIALLGAAAGISRQDPAWAIALQLLLTLPAAIAGAHVGPAPAGVAFHARWGMRVALATFCAASVALAASDGGVLAWAAFAATGVLLAAAVRQRFRGNVAA